jgi:hypothetical protein
MTWRTVSLADITRHATSWDAVQLKKPGFKTRMDDVAGNI